MRLSERVDFEARRLCDGAHKRDRRAFAVGARNVDDRRQLVLRVAERREAGPQPCEIECLAVAELGAEERFEAFERAVRQLLRRLGARDALGLLALLLLAFGGRFVGGKRSELKRFAAVALDDRALVHQHGEQR